MLQECIMLIQYIKLATYVSYVILIAYFLYVQCKYDA